MPPLVVALAYAKVLYYHLGSIALAALWRPFVHVLRPMVETIHGWREAIVLDSSYNRALRHFLGVVLKTFCCFEQIAYCNIDAALMQIGLHGYHFEKATVTGHQLWLRNERRVSHLRKIIVKSVQFSHLGLFAFSTCKYFDVSSRQLSFIVSSLPPHHI